jgi:hypothetical protein
MRNGGQSAESVAAPVSGTTTLSFATTADDVFHSLLHHASRDCARCGLGCHSRALLTMLRGYPKSAVQFLQISQRRAKLNGLDSPASVVISPMCGWRWSALWPTCRR